MLRHEVVGIAVCVSCLWACAQSGSGNPPAKPNAASQSTASVASLPAVRIIVQFNQPVAFQSAAFLHVLHEQTQAQVRYISAIFSDTHVYSFQPTTGSTYAQLLQRLSTMREISRVELDQKAQAN
jgi:hypothetical protein